MTWTPHSDFITADLQFKNCSDEESLALPSLPRTRLGKHLDSHAGVEDSSRWVACGFVTCPPAVPTAKAKAAAEASKPPPPPPPTGGGPPPPPSPSSAPKLPPPPPPPPPYWRCCRRCVACCSRLAQPGLKPAPSRPRITLLTK